MTSKSRLKSTIKSISLEKINEMNRRGRGGDVERSLLSVCGCWTGRRIGGAKVSDDPETNRPFRHRPLHRRNRVSAPRWTVSTRKPRAASALCLPTGGR